MLPLPAKGSTGQEYSAIVGHSRRFAVVAGHEGSSSKFYSPNQDLGRLQPSASRVAVVVVSGQSRGCAVELWRGSACCGVTQFC